MLITHQGVSMILKMLIDFIKKAKSILNLAQFDLRKWETNDINLKKQIQINKTLDSSDPVLVTDDLQLTTRTE